jgi:hypothetical protein
MRFYLFTLAIFFALASLIMALPELKGLEIEVLKDAAGAKRKTQRGDTISVHYRGTLTNGKEFDASYNRGQPLDFTVGKGQVIKGMPTVQPHRRNIDSPHFRLGRGSPRHGCW